MFYFIVICFFIKQPLDLGSSIPSSPSYSDSQDSGLCEFDQDAGGDDDGFIDDLVQEQGCQVWTVDSLLNFNFL